MVRPKRRLQTSRSVCRPTVIGRSGPVSKPAVGRATTGDELRQRRLSARRDDKTRRNGAHKEGELAGRVTEHVFFPIGGTIHYNGDNVTVTGDRGLHRSDNASFSVDRATGEFRGVTGFTD